MIGPLSVCWLALCLIGSAGVALAQPPEIPVGIWVNSQNYAGFDAACRLPDGSVVTCKVTIELHRQCWPAPATRPECERADINGDGEANIRDYSIFLKWYGKVCSEVDDE